MAACEGYRLVPAQGGLQAVGQGWGWRQIGLEVEVSISAGR